MSLKRLKLSNFRIIVFNSHTHITPKKKNREICCEIETKEWLALILSEEEQKMEGTTGKISMLKPRTKNGLHG